MTQWFPVPLALSRSLKGPLKTSEGPGSLLYAGISTLDANGHGKAAGSALATVGIENLGMTLGA